tara:strand:+ start:485 stop:1036 length:552 start_codon:yes stop_codon:yes gene_type:complete
MSVNKVILVGNLGQDPDFNTTTNNNSVVNFSVATTERWKDKNSGQQQEQVEWTRCVAYGRLAEIARDYLKKGSKVYVEGRLQTRKWQDKNGQDQYTTEVVLQPNGLTMLDSRGGQQQSGGQQSQPAPQHQQQPQQQQAPAQPAPQPQQQPQQPAPQAQPAQQQAPAQPAPQPAQSDFDDDIPF